MSRRYVIEIPDNATGNPEFHRGWVAGLLGLPEPTDNDGAQIGYETAVETDSVSIIGFTLQQMAGMGQVKVYEDTNG